MRRLSPGISGKLFLAVLFTAASVVLAMALAAQWNFNRGFLGYLNELEGKRLDAAGPRIVAAYLENGRNWDFLRGDRRRWFHLLRPTPGAEPEASKALEKKPDSSPQQSELTGVLLRTTLLDADGEFVIGLSRVVPNALRRPLKVEGKVIGWTVTAPFESVTAAGDVRFERSQYRASWTMGAVSVILAALVALWVARVLLNPLRQMAKATHRLAEGDYSIRVAVKSHDEVGQLAADFNRMAGALERTEHMRRNFMADLSHELRTPLGILNGELEAMEDGVRPLTREAVQSLLAEVSTLNKLVNDLYDLSLADAGAMTFRHTPLDLLDLLRTTALSYRPRFAERDISLTLVEPHVQPEPPAPMVVSGDARRLRQLLCNLLENTLHYTDRGGALRIGVRLTKQDVTLSQPMVELRFSDSAPGVTPEHLQRIFERFYRVEGSRSRASGGAGLGLAICQRIVEAHGGHMHAGQSELGGLEIIIELPAATGLAASVAKEPV